MSRILKNFRLGCTIAIFYPVHQVHEVVHRVIGVLIREPDKVLTIPLSLKNALAMNKQAIEFVNRDGTPLKCHGCNEIKTGLGKCARCELFCYCDRECQAEGWDDHKKYCKALKDKNIRKMLLLDYATRANGPVSFR
ncbi:hypothetical protein F4777DRAFT_530936 [Nemania sp. FL0916]|nr:hypothetical protein F4777DRAFT_530936 [Nemania sp. FL0916]